MPGIVANRKLSGRSCSFTTIYRGLRQQPISAAILHSANIDSVILNKQEKEKYAQQKLNNPPMLQTHNFIPFCKKNCTPE